MNMKPGEMGVVVRTCAMGGGARVPQEALGLVVRVSELVGTEFGPSWALSVPATFVAQKDYTAQFADGPGRVCRGDTVRVCHIPDGVLQPLRGLPVSTTNSETISA